jgi:hypothetical protein
MDSGYLTYTSPYPHFVILKAQRKVFLKEKDIYNAQAQ